MTQSSQPLSAGDPTQQVTDSLGNTLQANSYSVRGMLIGQTDMGYDALGRPQETTINADAQYKIEHGYNSLGALATLTYPVSTSGDRLKLQYDYQHGQLLICAHLRPFPGQVARRAANGDPIHRT